MAGELRLHRLLVSDGLTRLRGGSQNGGGALLNGLLGLVTAEVERTARRYHVERSGGQPLPCLPPHIISLGWSSSIPDLPVPATYMQLLAGVRNVRIQHQLSGYRIRVTHVLLNHGTLRGNTFPLINIGDHTGYRGYHRLSEKGRFANVFCSFNRIKDLGYMLAVCGVRVSGKSVIRGAREYSIATQAPFYVGWFVDQCKGFTLLPKI